MPTFKHDASKRLLYDQNSDQLLPPAVKEDRANWRSRNIFYVPGEPVGWLITANLILTAPSALALLFWFELPLVFTCTFTSMLTGGFIFGTCRIENSTTRRFLWGLLITGILAAGIQYHHPLTNTLAGNTVEQTNDN